MNNLQFDIYLNDLQVPVHKPRAGSNINLSIVNPTGAIKLTNKNNKENESIYKLFVLNLYLSFMFRSFPLTVLLTISVAKLSWQKLLVTNTILNYKY